MPYHTTGLSKETECFWPVPVWAEQLPKKKQTDILDSPSTAKWIQEQLNILKQMPGVKTQPPSQMSSSTGQVMLGAAPGGYFVTQMPWPMVMQGCQLPLGVFYVTPPGHQGVIGPPLQEVLSLPEGWHLRDGYYQRCTVGVLTGAA